MYGAVSLVYCCVEHRTSPTWDGTAVAFCEVPTRGTTTIHVRTTYHTRVPGRLRLCNVRYLDFLPKSGSDEAIFLFVYSTVYRTSSVLDPLARALVCPTSQNATPTVLYAVVYRTIRGSCFPVLSGCFPEGIHLFNPRVCLLYPAPHWVTRAHRAQQQ